MKKKLRLSTCFLWDWELMQVVYWNVSFSEGVSRHHTAATQAGHTHIHTLGISSLTHIMLHFVFFLLFMYKIFATHFSHNLIANELDELCVHMSTCCVRLGQNIFPFWYRRLRFLLFFIMCEETRTRIISLVSGQKTIRRHKKMDDGADFQCGTRATTNNNRGSGKMSPLLFSLDCFSLAWRMAKWLHKTGRKFFGKQ